MDVTVRLLPAGGGDGGVKVIWVEAEPPPGSLALTVTVSALLSLRLKLALPLLSVLALPLEGEAETLAVELIVVPGTGLLPLLSVAVTVTVVPVCVLVVEATRASELFAPPATTTPMRSAKAMARAVPRQPRATPASARRAESVSSEPTALRSLLEASRLLAVRLGVPSPRGGGRDLRDWPRLCTEQVAWTPSQARRTEGLVTTVGLGCGWTQARGSFMRRYASLDDEEVEQAERLREGLVRLSEGCVFVEASRRSHRRSWARPRRARLRVARTMTTRGARVARSVSAACGAARRAPDQGHRARARTYAPVTRDRPGARPPAEAGRLGRRVAGAGRAPASRPPGSDRRRSPYEPLRRRG